MRREREEGEEKEEAKERIKLTAMEGVSVFLTVSFSRSRSAFSARSFLVYSTEA